MPDLLNKQAIVNLLIDSPLREPIKINLIDIVNNTNEPDLPKVYSTIVKELEIFQKATERRMKLADETIAKLGGTGASSEPSQSSIPTQVPAPSAVPPVTNLAPVTPTVNEPLPAEGLTAPTLDLPPLPQMPTLAPTEPKLPDYTAPVAPDLAEPVSPVAPTTQPVPPLQPLGTTPMSSTSDEDALAEIQKELDSLKTASAADVAAAATPTPPTN
jgi:hypothetical protein